jgi:DNA (cytosine-5)-methyltransferase 1
MAGTAGEPIELLADDSGGEAEGKTPERPNRKGRSRGNGSYSLVPKSGAGQLQQYILLDDDDKDGDEPPNALTRSLRRLPTADDELIDLEEIEDDLLQLDDQVLQIEEAYFGGARPQDGRRSSRAVKIDPRNTEIVFPFVREESLKHLGSTLLPNKTVELRDGSFLRIKDVVLNTQTKAVKLRGHRLQRTRDMNGMLEKKMNECLLFLEVDLDDHRDPLAQAIVETPLAEVVQLRNVRYTNEKFPINRNLDFNQFNTKDAALETGGLTARWKYTCRYASAINRYHNTFTERSLERLMPDECTNGYSTPDAARRFKWRGGTILGGAYQPTIDKWGAIFLAESRQGSIVSIRSSEEADEFALVHVHSIDDSSDEEDLRNFARESGSHPKVLKRKHSQLGVSSSRRVPSRGQGQKKIRRAEEKSVKETREEMSRMSLQPGQKTGSRTNSEVIDLSSRLSVPIDLTQSDLATPLRKGSIRTNSRAVRPRSRRTAGQRLTYGDSFCGAGGATRGASMAGLRVIWGFDFWKRACETWEANFPYARCFCEPAHKFVEFAKRYPHLVKVDILHLSPPCQFFSPAHTINGVDDEMNTASLFAVQAVIEVTRPRIVTLEQTFGINHPRFRFYFNALIQMFTAHDFSIRWAIIPLAQWVCLSAIFYLLKHPLTGHQGLPQRRMRLIIIASW